MVTHDQRPCRTCLRLATEPVYYRMIRYSHMCIIKRCDMNPDKPRVCPNHTDVKPFNNLDKIKMGVMTDKLCMIGPGLFLERATKRKLRLLPDFSLKEIKEPPKQPEEKKEPENEAVKTDSGKEDTGDGQVSHS